MEDTVVLSVLGAKYVHASSAPWCLAAGIKTYAPKLYHRLHIVEGNINQPKITILKQIVELKPAIVGFSCYIWNIDGTLALCAALKQELPNVIIVLGGPEVSYSAEDILQNNTMVDYILAGEGEKSFPMFLMAFFANDNMQTIPGLCYRQTKGTILKKSPHTENIVPSPIIAGYAEAVQKRIAYFETSRGCPYSCAFCLSGSSGPRFFDLDNILPDLLILANSGARTIKFVDRTFNANPKHANKVLRFILNHYGKDIPWGTCFHFEIAGDILREETFDLLMQMPVGAVQLEIGIQSFHEKTLEAVKRKTNTDVLESNIKRLVSMDNMHIHIDLIAGLPYESLEIFAESFNKSYALGAQMLQLGFLKLLHGSAMRDNPHEYPCEFDKDAPYEVRETPWLSPTDIDLLHNTANAVDKVYNSGRFRLTADYVLKASGQTPYEFYSGLGVATAGRGMSLDDYTSVLKDYCESLPKVDREVLRDFLVRDRLSTNSEGRIPPCLKKQDEQVKKVAKWLSKNPKTAPPKNVRRGVAFLYAEQAVCWVDYVPEERNSVTRSWKLNELPFTKIEIQ